jgi:hypothetical protein
MTPQTMVMTVSDPIAAAGETWQDITDLKNAVRAQIAKYCGEPSLDYIAAETIAPNPKKAKV